MQKPSPRFRSEEYFVYEISEEMDMGADLIFFGLSDLSLV